MRWLLSLSALLTLGLALFCLTMQEVQAGEISTKISHTCAALAADGIVTNEREAWKRLTTGWQPIINPKWGAVALGFLLATVVSLIAAWKWPSRSAKEDRVV